MTGRNLFYLVIVLIFLGSLYFAFDYFRQNMRDLSAIDLVGSRRENPEVKAEPLPQPQVSFQKGLGGNLIVNWNNLPGSAKSLNIYRSRSADQKGTFWKKVDVGGGSGSMEIALSEREKGTDYYYYAEAVTGDPGAGPLWSFPSSPAAPPQTAPSPPPTSPETVPPPDQSGTQTPPPTSTPPAPPAPAPTGTVEYYTPDMQLSTTTPVTTPGNFGLVHRDNRINIWWTDLPAESTSFLVSRAESLDGPWLDLLRQTDPRASDSLTILDKTLREDHYYKMEVYRDELVIANYGPLLLRGLTD